MAATYDPIATQTLGSSATSVTFSSIPSTYTDLVLVYSAQNNASSANVTTMRFNGDTGTNYSDTYMYGNGTSAATGRDTNQSVMSAGDIPGTTGSTWSANIINVMNYSNTTTNKTAIMRHNTNGVTVASVGLWRSTSAINSITLIANTFSAGSTFSLFGIKAA